jgi:hypothetical protein
MTNKLIFRMLVAFLGYLIGRLGYFINPYLVNIIPTPIWNWIPHHWVLALILLFFSMIHKPKVKWKEEMDYLMWFSIGLLVSDGLDFLNLKLFGSSVADLLPQHFLGFD